MKFILRSDLNGNSHMKMLLFPFIAFIIFFLVADFLTTINNLGMTPRSIAEYYRGNEAKFLEPKSIVLILEEIHVRSFLFGFSLLVLASLLLQTDVSPRKKSFLIITSFASGLFDSLGGILIAYLHPLFSVPKILSWLGLYSSMSIMVLMIASHLWKRTSYSTVEPSENPSMPTSGLQEQELSGGPNPNPEAHFFPRDRARNIP